MNDIKEVLVNNKLIARQRYLKKLYGNYPDLLNITSEYDLSRKKAFDKYDKEIDPYLKELTKFYNVVTDDRGYASIEKLEGFEEANEKFGKLIDKAKKKLKKKLDKITKEFLEKEKIIIKKYEETKEIYDFKQ